MFSSSFLKTEKIISLEEQENAKKVQIIHLKKGQERKYSDVRRKLVLRKRKYGLDLLFFSFSFIRNEQIIALKKK